MAVDLSRALAVGNDHGTLPGSGVALPTDWALGVPDVEVNELRIAVPAAIRNLVVDPADVRRVGTYFTACGMLPVLLDGSAGQRA